MKVTKILTKSALFIVLVMFSSNVFAVEPTTFPNTPPDGKLTKQGTGEAGVLVEPTALDKTAPNKKKKYLLKKKIGKKTNEAGVLVEPTMAEKTAPNKKKKTNPLGMDRGSDDERTQSKKQ
ncbi:MAG: hypothetical protein QNK28_10740 [Desulfobacterales bacterium]|nr:hypothetical protein [Desulfobacterales bacterium]